jgi:hypothetical protein
MLIGIMGPHAVGKTQFLKNNMDWLADNCKYDALVVVLADLESEYHYNAAVDAWYLTKNFLRWKGHKEEKLAEPWLHNMIVDKTTLWIVESGRYFKGMQPTITDSYYHCGGGVRFIVPYSRGVTMVQFLKERCAKHNKELSEYWTPDNCDKESREFTNMIAKCYIPIGVPSYQVMVNENRVEWEIVKGILYSWIIEPIEKWYPYPGRK